MTFQFWQAPDRDSPTTLEFEVKAELGTQLDALMQVEGHAGTREAVIREVTGTELSRPRRWHKIFERMGLLYQDENGNTQLTELGNAIRAAKANVGRDFRRSLATQTIAVLRKFQLKNPADETLPDDVYPADADIHPYWAIWKAAVELGGKLHWDELNRELMWVLRHSDLDAAIARIRQARTEPGYDPVTGGSTTTRLRDRAYDQTTSPDARDPSGQVRDQKTTPWFKRAGLGELLFSPPGRSGNGYWTIHPDVIELLEAEVQKAPPEFLSFSDKQEWFSYYGRIADATDVASVTTSSIESYPEYYQLLESRHNVVFYGPPGTGKTHAALQIACEWERINGPQTVYKVTFHPSYGYEDFVIGYKPKDDGSSSFSLKEGILMIAAERAVTLAAEGKKVLLLIDEINRGDVARIFGELITYIEVEKRGIGSFLAQRPDSEFSVPQNLYFLGTMNTADKSISLLDVALRRRFAFVDFPADPSSFDRIPSWASSISGISLRRILEHLNERLVSEGIDSDRSVGQALMKVDSSALDPLMMLRQRFQYDIVPLIAEYCHLDRNRMQNVLGGLIDTQGRFSAKTNVEFENALKAWLGTAPSTIDINTAEEENFDAEMSTSI